MRLSREARILFAFVAVAAAAWIWINFFNRPATLTAEEGATDALTAEVADEGADELADAAADETLTGDGEAEGAAEAGQDADGDRAAGNDPATADVAAEGNTADANDSEEVPGDVDSDEATDPDTVTATVIGDGASSEDVTAVGGGTDHDDANTADDTADADGTADDNALEVDSAPDSDPELSDDMPLVAEDEEPVSTDNTLGVAQPQPVAARDVEIAELPFLVTEPPAPADEGVDEAEGGLELSRPRSGLRVTVNPFSPLVLAPQETTVTASAPPPTTPGVVNVPIPDGPTRLGTSTSPNLPLPPAGPGVSAGIRPDTDLSDISTPVPRPLTPQPLQASNLPRPLPGGTLSATPDILRTTRAAPAAPANPLGGATLGDVAALRLPGRSGATVTFDEAPPPALADTASSNTETSPLPVGNRRTRAPANTNDPLMAGATELSRYLRDNNFQFTGSVIGPVGVGVFRSSLTAAPTTVVLGQALQGTNIVLTSLKGKQAEFTQDDEKQVLTLDLR